LTRDTKEYFQEKWKGWKPDLGIVLGSGIQLEGADFKELDRSSCSEIPGLPVPAVEGHGGDWIRFDHDGRKILLLGGRVHLYEGHSVETVTTGMEILADLGCRHVILTNAAGGIRHGWVPGEVVLITGHLDFQRDGMITPGGSPSVFDTDWQDRLRQFRSGLNLSALEEGTYAGLPGPTYETPAEVRMLQSLGADLVGMSTIQEARVAREKGMKVVAFSLVTNAAAGTSDGVLNHEEVIEAGQESRFKVLDVVRQAIATSGEKVS